MLNIRELERRWLRYKIKSFIPHVAITLGLATIIVISIFYFQNEETTIAKKELISPQELPQDSVKVTKVEPVEKIAPKHIEKPIVEKVKKKPSVVVKPVANEEKKIKLSPSLDFMKKMNNSANPYYTSENYRSEKRESLNSSYEENTPKKRPIIYEQAQTETKKEVLSSTPTEEPKQQKINIKRQNTQNDIYDIIKRFKKNNNPALSLFVAKKYYELGNYRQAYNYSLMTNKINKDIESSWIIFSKSLVKLGKRDKAIKTLQKYIKYSDSNRAGILLDEIQSGKFR